jgi:transposase InsO family protein
MEERMKFMTYWLEQSHTMTALCRHFGISRKTGYKWLARFLSDGMDGLSEQSRAPHRQTRKTPPEIEAAIIAMAISNRSKRGPKKLRRLLELSDPEVAWPAVSTIGAILKRNGLVTPRRRRRKSPPYEQPLAECVGPNAVWSADFKGWFQAGNGERCDPLTISDNYSRYLLRCQLALATSFEAVQPLFVGAFEEYGLPWAIRIDNGPPFATLSVGGLSRLSVWWIRLGIVPERIKPGQPQQNPRHERMHRTLKDECCKPPRASRRRQQIALDEFRDEFNHRRPHESLDQHFPDELYVPSPRPYPLILPEMTYPDRMLVRRVKHKGDIKWKGRDIYLGTVLAGELVGLEQVAADRWDIYFGPIRLAQLDPVKKVLIHLKRPRTRRPKTRQ